MSRRVLVSWLLLLLLGGQAILSLNWLVTHPMVFPPNDFVEYWAAGFLSVHGENPYDPAQLYELQKHHIGWDPVGEAIMMWNPPWTLTVVMPLGCIPWRPAQLAWLLTNFVLLLASAYLLSGVYPDRPQTPWVVMATWLPCYITLQYGQISPWILFGFAAFLALEQRGRPFAAGLLCVLIAFKPHLAYLFWLALVWHAIATREWRILAGGLVGGVVGSIWPMVCNPHVFEQYRIASTTTPPTQWISPTFGAWVRVLSGNTSFWLQALPMIAGLIVFAWRVRTPFGRWADLLPGLILVSFVTAPYGVWPYDLSILSLVWVWLFHRHARPPGVVLFAMISLGVLACVLVGLAAQWFVWVSPMVLVAALMGFRLPETSA